MRRTRIKICGIKRPEDAAMAAGLGADAIGIILHPPSPRNVSIEAAASILAALPPFVTPVGLFVDSTAEQILATSRVLDLRHVQLHGHEPPSLLAALDGLFIIKAIRAAPATFEQSLNLWRNVPNLRGIVLETDGQHQPGGTGIENNWELIHRAQQAGLFTGLPPLIAAGGLNPLNVGKVVAAIRPWAVDVSSGVEQVRGQKSDSLVRQFIHAVRLADADD